MWEWISGNWIALAALVGAGVGWWDNRRRITANEIDFTIEPPDEHGYMRLRNIGKRTVFHQRIDAESVASWALEWNVGGLELDPQQSGAFKIAPDRRGKLPDSVRVSFRLTPGGKLRSRSVRLPDVADT